MIKIKVEPDQYAECNMCPRKKRVTPELLIFRVESSHPNRHSVLNLCDFCVGELVLGVKCLVDDILQPHYVLIREEGLSTFVKEGQFFEGQGGLKDDWGLHWRPVLARSIEHARFLGDEMKAGRRPMVATVGEVKNA